jgi:dihydroorotate dehydrogenase (NAD+) catalytic subunit
VKAKTGRIPIIVKLTPNVLSIGEIAQAVEDAGADGICAINTAGPGMMIDIDMHAPVLSNKVGGISGPALKPLAVRCVYDVYKAVKIPIIATGGIITGRDAIEMMMAGGTLFGVGTAVHYRGIDVFKKIIQEIKEWCGQNNIERFSDLIGMAHQERSV